MLPEIIEFLKQIKHQQQWTQEDWIRELPVENVEKFKIGRAHV